MSNLINGCFEFGVFVMEGKIKKNLVYNVCYQLLVIILPFITAPYVSRVLGAYNIGIYSYTQALANYFYLFVMLGVINYGNRTIAAIRDDRNTIPNRTITLRIVVNLNFSKPKQSQLTSKIPDAT